MFLAYLAVRREAWETFLEVFFFLVSVGSSFAGVSKTFSVNSVILLILSSSAKGLITFSSLTGSKVSLGAVSRFGSWTDFFITLIVGSSTTFSLFFRRN